MKTGEETPIDQLMARLKLLILFHLGADAVTTFNLGAEGLSVSVQHGRIAPFELNVGSEELSQMADDPDRLETLFLDLLVKYRRG